MLTLKSVLHQTSERHKVELAFLTSIKEPKRLAHSAIAHYFNDKIKTWMENNMPAKKRSTNDAYNISWLRVDLTEQQSAEFTAWWKDNQADLPEYVARMLLDGDKLSLTYSEKVDAFYCTVMGTEHSHRNGGRGFTSFAKDPIIALAVTTYKYWVILEGDMSEGRSQDDMPDFG